MTALLSLLQNIQQQSTLLLNCLKQEKLALNDNQLEKLTEISTQKLTLLEKLDQLDKQRIASSPDKNFNDFINSSKNSALIKQWQETRQCIAECQQQNEINGRLINKRSQINMDTLSIITGHGKREETTYNAQGNQSSQASLFNGIKA